MILKNPLPLDLTVPEPIILRFFSEFVEDLLFPEHTYSSKRFEKALHWEVVAMLVGGLAANNHWTLSITVLAE